MTVQTLTLEDFPQPALARALSPNGRAHWTQKRHCTQAVKSIVAVKALIQHIQPMVGHVVLQPTFIYPVARKRDDDNLATGVMKAVRDALVDAGVLAADDMAHLKQLPPEVVIKKGRRALILEFLPAVLNDDQAPASAHQTTQLADHQHIGEEENQ